MLSKLFGGLFDSAATHKKLVGIIALLLTIASAAGLVYIRFDNNVELMLPANDEICKSMRFLRESDISDKVIISFQLKSSQFTTVDLIAAVDTFCTSLNTPLVTDVVTGIVEYNIMGDMLDFLKYVPQLTNQQALNKIDRQISPQGVKTALFNNYRSLLGPAGSFMSEFISSDPLGINYKYLHSLEKLTNSFGYKINIKNGHFISSDGTHAMVILKTPVVLTDGFGSKKLINYIKTRLNDLPDYVTADIIAGHMHTISNETVIKKDIFLTLSISTIVFLLLFLFFFRDIKAVLLFVIPLVSVLAAINITCLILDKLSYFIIGMGGVIAGIAVDYGIHVYMAVRTGDGRPDSVKKVFKPIVTGALTTLGVFAAFFFSDVAGYRQLALFSIISILTCLLYALFLLPHFLGKNACKPQKTSFNKNRFFKKPVADPLIVCFWAGVMIFLLISCRGLIFSNDIKQFDGSAAEVLQAEQNFHQVWGGARQPAVFVVSGQTIEAALEKNERIYKIATEKIGQNNFTSFASIWQSAKTRQENLLRWNRFWKENRASKLKKLIARYGEPYNFREDAFLNFFDNITAGTIIKNIPDRPEFFSVLKDRFVKNKKDGFEILSFFPDEEKYVRLLSEVCDEFPDTFIVSRNQFANIISRSIASEIIYLAIIAGVMIPLLAVLLLRNIKLTLLSLIPVLSSIMTICGALPLIKMPMNAPSVIAGMVVVGLSIDYGIFMVYTCYHKLRTGTYTAVTLSAVTTLIGAGVLVFAKHPMLFSIGITLVTGILAGFLASIFVIPAIFRLWTEKKEPSFSC